jgi:hypothetical protein
MLCGTRAEDEFQQHPAAGECRMREYCCYIVVELLSHCCHSVVTLMSHCCHTIVTLLSLSSHLCHAADSLSSERGITLPPPPSPPPIFHARQVFDLEQGVCVLCAFDAHQLYQQVSTSVCFWCAYVCACAFACACVYGCAPIVCVFVFVCLYICAFLCVYIFAPRVCICLCVSSCIEPIDCYPTAAPCAVISRSASSPGPGPIRRVALFLTCLSFLTELCNLPYSYD